MVLTAPVTLFTPIPNKVFKFTPFGNVASRVPLARPSGIAKVKWANTISLLYMQYAPPSLLWLFMACQRQQNKASNSTLDGMRNKKGSDRADCEPDKRESKSCKTAVSSSYPAYHSHNVSWAWYGCYGIAKDVRTWKIRHDYDLCEGIARIIEIQSPQIRGVKGAQHGN